MCFLPLLERGGFDRMSAIAIGHTSDAARM